MVFRYIEYEFIYIHIILSNLNTDVHVQIVTTWSHNRGSHTCFSLTLAFSSPISSLSHSSQSRREVFSAPRKRVIAVHSCRLALRCWNHHMTWHPFTATSHSFSSHLILIKYLYFSFHSSLSLSQPHPTSPHFHMQATHRVSKPYTIPPRGKIETKAHCTISIRHFTCKSHARPLSLHRNAP